jgi:hypothetical protein
MVSRSVNRILELNKYIQLNMDIEYGNGCDTWVDDEDDERIKVKESKNKNHDIALKIDNVKKISFSEKPALSFFDIEPFLEMEDSSDAYFSYCSDINHLAYHFYKYNKLYPTPYKFSDNINSLKFLNDLFKHYAIPENSYKKMTYENLSESKISIFVIAFAKDLVLYLDGDNSGTLFYNIKDESDENSMLYKVLGLLKTYKNPKVTRNKIFIVYRSSSGFAKKGFNVKKINVDLEENYNDDFPDMSSKIITGLNSKDKTNLVILSGAPGVGKTTYIRYLASKLKKNIIFVSPDMVTSITDPAFIPFLMDNNDSILIIEDAEPALEKRGHGGRSSAVSNVLNLTDGLLSDCLNISIVATFNTGSKNIDEALLRKGRLLMNYRFDKLDIEKSKKLLKKLGHLEVEVTEPMTLSDIYYYGSENNGDDKEKRKIGFVK